MGDRSPAGQPAKRFYRRTTLGGTILDYELLVKILGVTVVAAPALVLLLLGFTTLIGHSLSERATSRVVQTAIVTGLLASLVILATMLSKETRHVPIELGSWVVIPEYHFSVKFVFDRLSVPFVVLTFVLCGTISAFATSYMHGEPGYNRFFVLYALFVLGMVVTSLADTIETLFAGWELVGLSSALLVGFFQERPAPVRNGLRVWAVYRVSDAALLIASVVLHHLRGQGDFDILLGSAPWPGGHAALTHQQALLVGGLLIVAAAGKSALVPFSGWLPRAMEGPTPSSAIFYGALSVHLGAFLLLRFSPIIELSPWLSATVVIAGLSTAAFASITGRVQTDVKGALSFASLTQVGLIVAEIGCGMRYLALIHILGHGCLRTLQFLRAPTLLHDYHAMENHLGTRLPSSTSGFPGNLAPVRLRTRFYRLALDRGHLDAWLANCVVEPFLRAFRWFDAVERRWTDFLAGGPSRASERVRPSTGSLEELI